MSAASIIPSGLSGERQRILEVALGELGVSEQPRASNRGPVERYLPRWQRRKLAEQDERRGRLVRGPAWCAFFALWCTRQALGEHILGAHVGSVWEAVRRARERGIWIELGGQSLEFDELPAPGDIFCQLSEPFDAGRSQGHCGIVVRCQRNPYAPWLTIDGNSGHRVRLTQRRPDAYRTRGVISTLGDFGRGDWERGWGGFTAASAADLSTR